MALGLDVKSSEPQLNIPKNEGQAIPINFVGQKKLPEQPKVIIEQPLIDQGIPTAPPAPELEANSNPIDPDEVEEQKAIDKIQYEGIPAYLRMLDEYQKEMEARMKQEPIGLATSKRLKGNKEGYLKIATKIFEINARTKQRINLDTISKVIVIPGVYEEIMKSLIGIPKLNYVFNPENIAKVKAQGLGEEDLFNQLFKKPKIPEIVKREPVQTSWGSAILEYKEAA